MEAAAVVVGVVGNLSPQSGEHRPRQRATDVPARRVACHRLPQGMRLRIAGLVASGDEHRPPSGGRLMYHKSLRPIFRSPINSRRQLLIQLDKHQYDPALTLFASRQHMMKLTALAEGGVQGELWADDAAQPSIAVARVHNKVLLASALSAEDVARTWGLWLREMAYERTMEGDEDAALLFWDGPEGFDGRAAWELSLQGRYPVFAAQECYAATAQQVRPADAPAGYELLSVDAALLGRELPHNDALREEMCSERASVEEFLRHSFGIAAVHQGELAGWCLSEYNCSDGCEVGIEVREGHRRQGLAAAMVSAFSREAQQRGVQRIGWLCNQANAASSATARCAGLARTREYGRLLCVKELAVELASGGDALLNDGDAAGAAQRLEQALKMPHAPLWAGVELAMAWAMQGQLDAAFEALEDVLAKGFANWGWLNHDPRLEPLRANPRWQGLPRQQRK